MLGERLLEDLHVVEVLVLHLCVKLEAAHGQVAWEVWSVWRYGSMAALEEHDKAWWTCVVLWSTNRRWIGGSGSELVYDDQEL